VKPLLDFFTGGLRPIHGQAAPRNAPAQFSNGDPQPVGTCHLARERPGEPEDRDDSANSAKNGYLGSDSLGISDARKITRNLSLTLATFRDTGVRRPPVAQDNTVLAGLRIRVMRIP
jgi:hypothetical protein